jgi:microcystin degradation protein MlrC
VTTDGQPRRARAIAAGYATELWQIRDSDLGHYLDIDAAIKAALASAGQDKPAVIADAGDNPGAGTGGDATWILREVLSLGLDRVAMALFWDPAALAAIVAAGEGASLELCLGGHTGALAGSPVRALARVLCVNPKAEIDAMPGYPPLRVGTLAAVEISGVKLVVGAYREQVFGPRVFSAVGVEPLAQRILVVKSAQHFYAAFAPLANRIVYCDSPCSRTVQFSALPFAHRRRPIWPLDECDAGAIPAPLVF